MSKYMAYKHVRTNQCRFADLPLTESHPVDISHDLDIQRPCTIDAETSTEVMPARNLAEFNKAIHQIQTKMVLLGINMQHLITRQYELPFEKFFLHTLPGLNQNLT